MRQQLVIISLVLLGFLATPETEARHRRNFRSRQRPSYRRRPYLPRPYPRFGRYSPSRATWWTPGEDGPDYASWSSPSVSVAQVRSSAFSVGEAQEILDYHNRLRANVVPAAANMMEMNWNDRLAARAQRYAEQCDYRHSPKSYRKNQDGFKNIGENIYISTSDDFRRALEFWGNEYRFYDFRNNYCMPGEKCGHYTQMAWHWSREVGCGHAFCRRVTNWRRNNAYFTVCMYAPQGNWNRERPYTPGAPCSLCPEGTSCRGNLCG